MRVRLIYVVLFILLSPTILAQVTFTNAFPNITFSYPVEIQSPNDNSNRLFIVEQEGIIRVFDVAANVVQQNVATFLDITDRVSFSVGQEIGLLGLAFHPNYDTNRKFYVYYTANSPVSGVNVRIVLSEFTASSSNMNSANSSSERIIFEYDKNQSQSNHNGGKIAFGPDGYLYISVGDGGGGNDPNNNAQNKNNVFGSIVRVDVDLDNSNSLSANGAYEIPSDNPYVGQAGLDEIYAIGIRNTWKFSFDDSTNRLWGADVGQGDFEEINLIENGKNYGWDAYEGFNLVNSTTVDGTPTDPVFVYDHTQGDVSITGGYVYRGSAITSLSPNISEKYIYGDFVSGRVWALEYTASTGQTNNTLLFESNIGNLSSFGVDENDEIYFCSYRGSDARIYKLIDGTTPPQGTQVSGFGAWTALSNSNTNGVIKDIRELSNGSIYAVGDFTSLNGLAANNIAVWNQNAGWQTIGTGTNGVINALEVDTNGNLYIGGAFTEINGVSANNIAMFNGASWVPLGSGIDGVVAVIHSHNAQLYVGGIFDFVNGQQVNNIAQWNGSSWSPLTDQSTFESGMNNEVRSLATDTSGMLYAGGNFDEAGGVSTNRIALWNGSNWQALGGGTSGFVEAIAVQNNDVYVGGNFASAGGATVNRIARWNTVTSSWHSLDDGLSGRVTSLLHNGNYLFAGGGFDLAFNDSQTIIVNNMARWNSADGWEALGTNTNVGVDQLINSIQFSSDSQERILVGGNFSSAGLAVTKNAAIWESENILSTDDVLFENTIPFPNPTSGELRLPVNGNWYLYSNLGAFLKKEDSGILNLRLFKPGVYYLKNEYGQTHKIIKVN